MGSGAAQRNGDKRRPVPHRPGHPRFSSTAYPTNAARQGNEEVRFHPRVGRGAQSLKSCTVILFVRIVFSHTISLSTSCCIVML